MKAIRLLFFALALLGAGIVYGQSTIRLKKKDRRRDVELQTTDGRVVLRLSDSTPEHRDNFLRLVKSRYFDSLLFHRVIPGFMIQGGDPDSRRAAPRQALGRGGPGYTLPAEFHPALHHRRGAVAAARNGDAANPERRSSGSQFYIVHGRTFTNAQLDSVETARLQGRKLSPERRAYYKTVGGTPQLDGNYTVFGQVVEGQEVVDRIAETPTSNGADRDRPLQDVRIIEARLVKRKKART